jgi:hypothetical protein
MIQRNERRMMHKRIRKDEPEGQTKIQEKESTKWGERN